MPDRTIEALLKLKPDDKSMTETEKAVLKNYQALKKVEEQANRTREKMEKLAQVGTKLTLVGGAILAPFALSMKTYLDNATKASEATGKLEPTAQRLKDLGERWTKSQERLGRVTAEIVLPALEKAADVLDRVVAFAEKNPAAVQAALGIGGSLVVVGGIVTTIAQVVSTIATVKGLFAGAALAGAGGNAAAGAAALTVGGIQSAIAAAAPVIVSAIAVWAGANLGLIITNALTGQNYTMTDLANGAKLILALNAKGLDMLAGFFGLQPNLFKSVSDAIGITADQQNRINMMIAENQAARINSQAVANTNAINQTSASGWTAVAGAIASIGQWFSNLGGRASGGYVGGGVYRVGEMGREFVLSNATTMAAERAIGSRLTQADVLRSITNNVNLSNGMTVNQVTRIVRAANADLISSLLG